MITKDEWAEIENKLKSLYCDIRFTLDGRKVTVQKQMISNNQLGLAVFIDGILRGGAGMPGNEKYDPLTQKVWRRTSKSFLSHYKKIEGLELCRSAD